MGAVKYLTFNEACDYYDRLPVGGKIATLTPEYVAIDAMRDQSLMPFSVLYEEGNKFWLLSAHMKLVPNTEYWAISSPYGYGGPLANNADPEFNFRAWVAYKKWAHESLVLAEVMKLHPLAHHPYGGQLKFNRFAYTCGQHATDYNAKCRNKVMKAQGKKLTFERIDPAVIAKNFPVDYRQCMADMKADSFYMFNDAYFDALSKFHRAYIVIVEHDEEWRSCSIILAHGNVMESHLTITNEKGREQGATNYLVHQVRQMINPNVEFYLGGGKTTSPQDPLGKFKASFGGKKLRFDIGWHIHRPDVYSEMKQGITSDKILWWQ